MRTDPRAAAESFAEGLMRTFGDSLRSVILFGSVARGEAVPGVSDINLLVLLDEVDLRHLGQGAPLARDWVKGGNPTPLLLSWDEWLRSTDSFAIEMSDMKEARDVLHGEDALAAVEVDPADLRLQAERELRERVVQMRLSMLVAGDEPREVGRQLAHGLPSVTSYMRAILRLNGDDPSGPTEDVIRRATGLAGTDAGPFLELWEARSAPNVPSISLYDPLASAYVDSITRLVDYLDALPAGRIAVGDGHG